MNDLPWITEAPKDETAYQDKAWYKTKDRFGNVYKTMNPRAAKIEITYKDDSAAIFPQDSAPVFDSSIMRSLKLIRPKPILLEEVRPTKHKKNIWF